VKRSVILVKKEPEPEESKPCPFVNTHDKFNEAHYFISQMVHTYHEPEPFGWNFDAFLQALRSVTFVMQKELKDMGIKDDWYQAEQEWMKKDKILLAVVEGRNIVVHQGMIEQSSNAEMGMFRGRMLKLAAKMPVPPHIPSATLLEMAKKTFGFVDEEHSAIDEQYGVRRQWFCKIFGDEEIVSACDKAWSRIGKVFAKAHEQVGREFDGPPEHGHDTSKISLLLESDVDPTLPQKWGWTSSEADDRRTS